MTPVFCCGGECGISSLTGTYPHWASGTSVLSFDTVTVRSGARSIKISSSSAAALVQSCTLTAAAIWVVRFYIRFSTLPGVDTWLFQVLGASEYQGVWFKVSDSKIYAGGTSGFGASGVAVTTGTWYRIDVRLNFGANPHLADVQVDGTACGQYSFAASATTGANLNLGWKSTTATAFFEDVIASNTSGDYPIGAGEVNHFVPTSDGSHNIAGANDFERGTTGTDIVNATTDSYLLVDEVPMDDTTPDTDDYINCVAPPNATDYTENVFGPAPGIDTPTTGPRAVEVIVADHQVGTGSGVSAIKLNDNGTVDAVVSRSGAGVTTTRYSRKHYALMPADSAEWTAARFNNLRVRFGYSSDANPDQCFDCAMIEAEFGAGNVTTPQTITGKARIRATTTKTQTGKARIRKTVPQTQLGKASIVVETTKTQLGKARIRVTTSRTQLGLARVRITSTRTQAGKARIRVTAAPTQLGKARIRTTASADQTGLARIHSTTPRTQLGKARVRITTPQTITGKAKISKAVSQTQTGLARIRKTVAQTQDGLAAIRATTQQTQDGLARIRITSSKTQLGKARVRISTPRTQTGKSRIQATTPQTQDGKARIRCTVQATQDGLARIRKTASSDQTGLARIRKPVSQVITGKAKIATAGVAQTISGKARITATTSQTITGKARISTGVVVQGRAWRRRPRKMPLKYEPVPYIQNVSLSLPCLTLTIIAPEPVVQADAGLMMPLQFMRLICPEPIPDAETWVRLPPQEMRLTQPPIRAYVTESEDDFVRIGLLVWEALRDRLR